MTAKSTDTMRREAKQWWALHNKGRTMSDFHIADYNAMAIEIVSQTLDVLSANTKAPIDVHSLIESMHKDWYEAKERHKESIKNPTVITYDITEDGIKETRS